MNINIAHFDLFIIIAYIILVTGYGLWKAKNVKDSEGFLVAGRSLGLFVLAGTLAMTEFNTATMVGLSSFAYMGGYYAHLIQFAGFIGLLSYTLVVAKRWKRLNAISIAEMFEQRYNKNFRTLASIMLMVVLVLFSPAYLKAASLFFSISLNIPLTWTVILISTLVLIFSVAGGLTSVAFTNAFSFILTIIALPLLWFFARSHAVDLGGTEAVFAAKYLTPNPSGMWHDPVLPYKFIFSVYFLVFFIYMQAPWYAQNMFASKNERTAYGGMALATIIIVLLYGISMQTAVFAKVGFPNLDDPQKALPSAVTYWLPIGVRGLTLAVILAVCQTTMASIWNNTVSIVTQDVYRRAINPKASEKRVLLISRILTLGIAIFTIIVSITMVDQVINVLYFANIFMASLFFPVLGGFLWWRAGEKASWISAILGIVSGLSIHLWVKHVNPTELNAWMFPYYCFGIPITIFVGIFISYIERPREAFLKKKLAFYQKVGAPWFGKKEYYQYLEQLGTGSK